MLTRELDYDLPPGVIATAPAEPRDAARMMVVSRSRPDLLEHRRVRDLPDYLAAGDLMVFNRTRVLPARFHGRNPNTGGKVEGLYLNERPAVPGSTAVWTVMLKARRIRPGMTVALDTPDGSRSGITLTVLGRADEAADAHAKERGEQRDESSGGAEEGAGGWAVEVRDNGEPAPPGRAPDLLTRVGLTPLPPYILAARKSDPSAAPAEPLDRERYQTVYAREAGSVAAPTAGLHFTPELLHRLDARGVERAEVLLHVGAGTFKPVEAERLADHPMHREWCAADPALLARVASHARGDTPGRVFAVGTTTVRTLESYAALPSDSPPPPALDTRLLIAPGYPWRWVQGVVTNFHLPRSTLLALVAALLERPDQPGSGIARLRNLYAEAIREGYRFYSYGDCMLILP